MHRSFHLFVWTSRTMSGLFPSSASISAISAAWVSTYQHNNQSINQSTLGFRFVFNVDWITLSNMALLPSKSNSSFTWCCSSSVRAVPPYRSWKKKNTVNVLLPKGTPPEKKKTFFFQEVFPNVPLLATRYVCSCHHRHFQRDIVLKKIDPIHDFVTCVLSSRKPLECFGDARISRNLGLSLFTASLVTL